MRLTQSKHRRVGWVGRVRRLLVVPLAGAAMFTVAACDESAGPEEGPITLEEIADDDSDALLGETVNVSGEVAEVISDRAFTLGENLDDTVLVVSAPDAGGLVVEEGVVVEVTGTVDEFVFQEYQDDFGFDDADEETLGGFEEENIIIAESAGPVPTEGNEG